MRTRIEEIKGKTTGVNSILFSAEDVFFVYKLYSSLTLGRHMWSCEQSTARPDILRLYGEEETPLLAINGWPGSSRQDRGVEDKVPTLNR